MGVSEHTAADLTNKQNQQQFLANKNMSVVPTHLYNLIWHTL
jgi:hypothetical protein